MQLIDVEMARAAQRLAQVEFFRLEQEINQLQWAPMAEDEKATVGKYLHARKDCAERLMSNGLLK